MKNEMNKESREMMKQVILNSAIKVGEKEFINVPIELLVVPEEYQRATGNKISKIIANYDVNKLRIPIVSYRDNEFILIDGNNRTHALLKMGYQTVTCELLRNLTIEQEADIFVTQNENVNKITPKDKLKGNALKGDQFSIDFLNICKKYKLTYNQKNVRNITSITRMHDLWKTAGKEGLIYCVEVMFNTHWKYEANPFTSVTCRMFNNVIKVYGFGKTEKLTMFLDQMKDQKELETLSHRIYPSLSKEKAVSQYVVDILG